MSGATALEDLAPDGITLSLVPWGHPDVDLLQRTQQDELRERYGAPAPEPHLPSEQMLAAVLVHVDGQVAGCGALRNASHHGMSLGEIKRMFVLPERRGAGLGTHVVRALERIAGGHGLDRLILETGMRQPEAIRLYRGLGYRRIPAYGVYVDEPESVCYARWLAPADATRALVVSGSVGSGKTTVAAAVGDLLAAREIPHAVLDLDELTRVWPRPADDRFVQGVVLDGLAAIAPAWRARGYRHLVLPRVVEDPAEREHYELALDGADVTVVRLTADEDVRRTRLAARHGAEESLAWHLDRTVELERMLSTAGADDAVVDTTDLTVAAAAEQVLVAAGW